MEAFAFARIRARLQRLRKKVVFLWAAGSLEALFRGFRVSPFQLSSFLVFLPTPLPGYYRTGTNFTMRTRLCAAAVRRNNQSMRPRPRSLVWRSPATVLIQPNTFSTRRRIF